MPPGVAGVLWALGFSSVHVGDTTLRGTPDHDLVAMLPQLSCDWYLTLDKFRQPETWSRVYEKVADGKGRLIRVNPKRRKNLMGPRMVAFLAEYMVVGFETWSGWLDNPAVAMIELGARWTWEDGRPIPAPNRGPNVMAGLNKREVASLLQQTLFAHSGQPRLRKAVVSQRGRGRSAR